MPSIRTTITFDCSAVAVYEKAFTIAIPEGQCIEVSRFRLLSDRSVPGTVSHNGLYAAIAAEQTALVDLDTDSLVTERALIGDAVLSAPEGIAGAATIPESFGTVRDDPYALDLRAIVGQRAIVATGPTVEVLFDVEYQFRRITTAVGVALAAK